MNETVSSLGGNVKYIAALDMEHHIFLSEWATAFPNAHIIGPEGLAEKRQKDSSITKHVDFISVFSKTNKKTTRIGEDFDRDFEYEFVEAHPNKEIVFFYKPDKVLIEADLMFNLPAHEQYSRTGESPTQGILSKLFAGIQTTTGSAVWQKRMLWYAFSASDRPSFNKSVERIDSWGFDTIVPCHGDVIQGNAKGVFRKVFEWHLQGKAKAL